MREVRRSALVPYPAESMFALIADVDAYHEYLPGCTRSGILEESADGAEREVVATLGLSVAGLDTSFTTRNRLVPPRTIDMSLVKGPFRALEGRWEITPLGEDGSKLELTMRFAFASRINDALLGPVFERICNSLVDAFVRRAGELYD